VSTTKLGLHDEPGSRAQYPEFSAVMRGETYLSDLKFVTGAGQRLPIFVPVFDAARQKVIGILSAELALRHLLEEVGMMMPEGHNAYAYVVDDRGQIATHVDDRLSLAQIDANAIPETQDFLAGLKNCQAASFSTYNSLTGELVFGVHAPIRTPNWSIIVEQPAEDMMDHVQVMTLGFVFLWGVIILLVVGLVVTVTLFVARPVTQLTQAAQRLAAGDRSIRVPVKRHDEVSRLAVAFNNMAKNIQQAEATLRIERDNLKNIFEAMEDGIYTVSSEHDIQYMNPVLINEFGSYEEFKCYKYFNDRDDVCPWCKMSDVFEGKTVHWEWYSIKNRKTYDMIGTPLKNPDGSMSKLEIFRDITERKQVDEELEKHRVHLQDLVTERTTELNGRVVEAEQLTKAMFNLLEDLRANQQQLENTAKQLTYANKELEGFSYSVSHDLRAPLRHMCGFTGLLEKRAADSFDDKSKRYLGIIKDSAEKMGQLIDDLLHYSRTGRAEMQKQRVNSAELVHGVINDLKAYNQDRQIDWLVGQLPPAFADHALLQVIWINLLGNAVKFTGNKDKATIEIGSQPGEKDEVVYFVKDNGAGFDIKYKDKLFGVFQRLHRDSEFEGTGIGLATIQRIIHRHGGHIWAEGAVDEGAIFFFALPKEI